ncbi:hypothetical protein M758_UG140500 [Ceratodon purpureus]|nr:hypothetical protein M758_UG140500 [Ceratodon purpureus]
MRGRTKKESRKHTRKADDSGKSKFGSVSDEEGPRNFKTPRFTQNGSGSRKASSRKRPRSVVKGKPIVSKSLDHAGSLRRSNKRRNRGKISSMVSPTGCPEPSHAMRGITLSTVVDFIFDFLHEISFE